MTHFAAAATPLPAPPQLQRSKVLSLLADRRATAAETPTLLHKRAGAWRVFRWGEVADEVERLVTVLRGRDVGPDSRLALSGILEPDLIFVALAAHALGAALYPVDRALQGEALSRGLATIRPTHAFVQGRRVITRWLAVAPAGDALVPLFTAQPIAAHDGRWRLEALWPEQDEAALAGTRASRRAILGRRAISWVDESTEWPEGVSTVIDAWTNDDGVLAFPETGESAARDRREIRPHRLIASPAGAERVASEVRRRLPATGSWRYRLIDLARAGSGYLLGRLARARLERILGLPTIP